MMIIIFFTWLNGWYFRYSHYSWHPVMMTSLIFFDPFLLECVIMKNIKDLYNDGCHMDIIVLWTCLYLQRGFLLLPYLKGFWIYWLVRQLKVFAAEMECLWAPCTEELKVYQSVHVCPFFFPTFDLISFLVGLYKWRQNILHILEFLYHQVGFIYYNTCSVGYLTSPFIKGLWVFCCCLLT